MTEIRIALDEKRRQEIDDGRFVSARLPQVITVAGNRTISVLIGKPSGRLKVFANVCRHQAVPLDLGVDSPMSDDGLYLVCNSHGAMYRPDDGYCITGPCRGERLFAMQAREEGDAIVLTVGDSPAP